jgi:hypothetical protein
MTQVLGDRALIQFTNIYEMEEVPDASGKRLVKKEVYKDFSREGKVLDKGTGEFADTLKKGMMVYAMPFGGVEVEKLSSKKYRVVCIPAEDVYLVI